MRSDADQKEYFRTDRHNAVQFERMCNMKFFLAVLVIAAALALDSTAQAQEPELINEIVARVNNDIVTKADYTNALRDFKDELFRQMREAGKSEAEANAEFERLKPTVLDYMI